MHLFLLVMKRICCFFLFFIWTVMDWLLSQWHLFQPQQPARKKEEWVKFEPIDHKNLWIRSSFSSLISNTLRSVRQTSDSSFPKHHPPKIERTLLQGWYALVYMNIPSFNKQTAKVSCKPYLTDIANCSFIFRQIGSLTKRALLLWFSPIITKKIQQ